MKSNLKLGIILLVLVILITAIMQAGQKEPINWSPTYELDDKNPYGLYVLHKELGTVLDNTSTITPINQSVYTFLEEEEYNPDGVIFNVGSYLSFDNTNTNRMLKFVKEGGTIFLASNFINYPLIDTLNLAIEEFSPFHLETYFQDSFKDDSTTISTLRYRDTAFFDRIEYPNIFTKLSPGKEVKIIGESHFKGVSAPNFIKISFGKGAIYFHAQPVIFTNYYLLQPENYPVAAHALSYLKNKDIYWYDSGYRREYNQTPMRYILSVKTLRTAWYILLFSLLFYLLFKSKREQRAVPIVLPEENKSVAFAQTIGSLYYENGTPGDMVNKKIKYFLFELRKQFYLDTSDLNDKRFIQSLVQRTGLPREEIMGFLDKLQRVHRKKNHTVYDLKFANRIIEEFKEKANIL